MRFWFPVWLLLTSVLCGFSGVGSISGTDIHEPLPLPENKGDGAHARFYYANLGRFHTLDEYEGRTGEPLSLHKYLYAHGNPVTGWDPSGRMALVSWMQTVAIVGILADITLINITYPIVGPRWSEGMKACRGYASHYPSSCSEDNGKVVSDRYPIRAEGVW